MLIKPGNGLNKSLLLGKLLMFLRHIASNREAMGDTTEEIDLIWLFGLDEDNFRFVTFLGCEDLVYFCGCDGERAFDCCEFGFFHEAGFVRCDCCVRMGWSVRTMDEQ